MSMFKLRQLHRLIFHADARNLRHVLDDSIPVICVFGAQWSPGTLKMLLIVIPRMMQNCGGMVRFAYVNLQEMRDGPLLNESLRERYGIALYPTAILFMNGEEVARMISEEIVDEQIEDISYLLLKAHS